MEAKVQMRSSFLTVLLVPQLWFVEEPGSAEVTLSPTAELLKFSFPRVPWEILFLCSLQTDVYLFFQAKSKLPEYSQAAEEEEDQETPSRNLRVRADRNLKIEEEEEEEEEEEDDDDEEEEEVDEAQKSREAEAPTLKQFEDEEGEERTRDKSKKNCPCFLNLEPRDELTYKLGHQVALSALSGLRIPPPKPSDKDPAKMHKTQKNFRDFRSANSHCGPENSGKAKTYSMPLSRSPLVGKAKNHTQSRLW